MNRATVSQDCITAFNELKLSKSHKYIIFKLSDDSKEIVVEEASTDKDWENFREKLISAKSKNKMVRSFPGTHAPITSEEGSDRTDTGTGQGGPWSPVRRLRLRVQPCLRRRYPVS